MHSDILKSMAVLAIAIVVLSSAAVLLSDEDADAAGFAFDPDSGNQSTAEKPYTSMEWTNRDLKQMSTTFYFIIGSEVDVTLPSGARTVSGFDTLGLEVDTDGTTHFWGTFDKTGTAQYDCIRSYEGVIIHLTFKVIDSPKPVQSYEIEISSDTVYADGTYTATAKPTPSDAYYPVGQFSVDGSTITITEQGMDSQGYPYCKFKALTPGESTLKIVATDVSDTTSSGVGSLAIDVKDNQGSGAIYSATFNGNGGTYNDGVDSGKTTLVLSVYDTQSIQLPVVTFNKDGSVLTGWKITMGGSTETYRPGESIVVTGNLTAEAQWIDRDELLDGATLLSTIPYDTCAYGSEYSTTFDCYSEIWKDALKDDELTVDYEISFVGDTPSWANFYKKSSSIDIFGNPTSPGIYVIQLQCVRDSMMTGVTSDTVAWIVAVPSSTDSVGTVKFSLDGGTGSVADKPNRVGSAIILPAYTDDGGTLITKNGYTLVGWKLPDGNGGYPTYNLGSAYTVYTTGEIQATAVWERERSIGIFSLDGGSLDNVQAFLTNEDGYLETISDVTNQITKPGYIFLGWNLNDDRGVSYAPGLRVQTDELMKFVAYWVPVGTELSTITFNANGGHIMSDLSTQRAEDGMYIVLPDGSNLSRSNYTFAGWSETKDGEPIKGSDVYAEYEVNGSKTLYAVWEKNQSGGGDGDDEDNPDEPQPTPVYNVIFRLNGGTGSSISDQQVLENGLVYRPYDPEREGYIFTGWQALGESRNWNFNSDTVTSDTILVAQWDKHFTISIVNNVVTVTMETKYRYNTSTVYWDDVKDPGATSKIENGTANHAYVDADGSGYHSSGYITVVTVDSSDASVRYSSKIHYSVDGYHVPETRYYDVFFETGCSYKIDSQSVEAGGLVKKPADPVWEGHTFSGWYYKGTLWDFENDTIQQDITLTAAWDDNKPVGPDPIQPIYPSAVAEVTMLLDGSGWRLVGAGSSQAVSYQWYIDGKDATDAIPNGNVANMNLTISYLEDMGLGEGNHTIYLRVVSQTGNDSWSSGVTITVPGDEDEDGTQKSWIEENWVIVVVIVILAVIIIAVVATRLV